MLCTGASQPIQSEHHYCFFLDLCIISKKIRCCHGNFAASNPIVITSPRRLTDNVQGVKAHLQSQSEEPGCTLPPQASLQDWVKRGQALAAQCNTLLQQLAWLLHCCPEDLQKEEVSSCKQHTLRCPSPLAAQRQPPGCLMRRGDAAWCQLHQRVTTMLEETLSLKVELDCAAQSISDGVLHTW